MTSTVFTICSANYLPTVKVLMDSLAHHEPDTQRVLVLVERDLSVDYVQSLAEALQCRVVPVAELALPDLARMAFQYDIIEFNTAVKPFVFQKLMDEGANAVIYLDPDIRVYQPLTALWQQLREEDAVVTPHLTQPLPDDGLTPSNENMARCGQYNFGFVGFAARPAARRYIDWWAGRLTDHCIFHPDHYYFVDQFYGALVTSFIPRTRVWMHQGYNYAYWNAPQRQLQGDAQAGWTTPDGPLVFFHFSGFSHGDPDALSRHQNRVRAEPGSALSRIAHDYLAAINRNQPAMQPWLQDYSFGHYDDGSAIDALDRQCFRDWPAAEKARIAQLFDPSTKDYLKRGREINDAGGSANGLLWQLARLQQVHTQTQTQAQQWEHEVQQLRDELAQARADVMAIEGSRTYRLGRLLTAPLRLLRRIRQGFL